MTTAAADTRPAVPSTPSRTGTHRNLLWRSMQLIFQVIFALWVRYRARGHEHLPRQGGALFLANHQSFLDPLLIGVSLQRPISYLARDSLFRIPVIGWILKRTYVKPINRENAGTASLRATLQALDEGYFCGVFPEGTRSRDGKVGEIKPGFIALLRRTRSPIHPVGVAGAHHTLGRGSCWFKPRRVRVVFGPALDPEQVRRLCEKGREAELVAYVRGEIIACQAAAEAWRQQ